MNYNFSHDECSENEDSVNTLSIVSKRMCVTPKEQHVSSGKINCFWSKSFILLPLSSSNANAKLLQSFPTLCDPMAIAHQALLSRDSPGMNTGMGYHFLLLQGIFLTQGLNPHLLHVLHRQVDSLPLVPPQMPPHLKQFKKINQIHFHRRCGCHSSHLSEGVAYIYSLSFCHFSFIPQLLRFGFHS